MHSVSGSFGPPSRGALPPSLVIARAMPYLFPYGAESPPYHPLVACRLGAISPRTCRCISSPPTLMRLRTSPCVCYGYALSFAQVFGHSGSLRSHLPFPPTCTHIPQYWGKKPSFWLHPSLALPTASLGRSADLPSSSYAFGSSARACPFPPSLRRGGHIPQTPKGGFTPQKVSEYLHRILSKRL